ncbi:MAG: hypothetical protein GQ570_00035 [Helicobacteraceae bacterium]|nr:hypothetical protein [Helicobacteraceae bacterium]
MKHLTILILITIIFSGCVNKRGISSTYYNDCKQYYDYQGFYHNECEKNMVEFKDVKKDVEEYFAPGSTTKPVGNVY